MFRTLCVVTALLMLAACGGGGSHSSGVAATTPAPTTPAPPAPTPAPPALTNFTPLTVDAGPSVLATGPNAYEDDNVAFVSVTLCVPGTSQCQTIDHVQLDTGSVGLRIVQSVLSPALAAAFPVQTDPGGNAVGECYQYIDGYTFGSVRQADFQIGGETVANMPFHVIGDTGTFATVPSSCSSGGGSNFNTVQSFGSNGIIGVGVTGTDCGSYCTTAGGSAAAIYYDCPVAGCAAVIARASSSTAPFQQLPNPVAAMAVDNNGTIVSLPRATTANAFGATGTLYFGIGTQTNNGLGAATVLQASSSTSRQGPGLITATFQGQSLRDSFLDSGSNLYLFISDSSIPTCTGADTTGYYCPPTPVTLATTLAGVNGTSVAENLDLENAETQFKTGGVLLPGIGGNPVLLKIIDAYPNSFDFGLPFFFGRNVYTAIEGRTAGGVAGPFYAF